MTVIAPDERAEFLAILARHRLDESDFLVHEGGASDVVDDVYPLQGQVTITRRSTSRNANIASDTARNGPPRSKRT